MGSILSVKCQKGSPAGCCSSLFCVKFHGYLLMNGRRKCAELYKNFIILCPFFITLLMVTCANITSFSYTDTSHEGVFRKPGNKLRISQLVEELSKGRFYEVLQDSITHPHDLASILKQYFSELQEPLLLSRHLDAYLQIAGTCASNVFIVN